MKEEKISKKLLGKIADKIEQTDAFKHTLNEDGIDSREWNHTYHAFRLFNSIIIYSDFMCRIDNSREFLVYDEQTDTLRDTTELEDEIIREYDDNNYLNENDDLLQFVISRETDNGINRADKLRPIKKVSVKRADIEKSRKIWREVARENKWSNKKTFVQCWIDSKGKVVDSISSSDMTKDVFLDIDHNIIMVDFKD